MNLKLETAPLVEPVNTADAKLHLKVSGSTEDAYIDSLVKTARLNIERYLGRALITQTWKAYFDKWQRDLMLAYSPVQNITSMEYYNTSGTLTALTEGFWEDLLSEPARIVRKKDTTYPELQDGKPNAIVVEYVCGYGDAATDVPADIVHAIKLLVTDYYDNKGEVVVGTIATRIPGHIKNLLHPYRLYDFAD